MWPFGPSKTMMAFKAILNRFLLTDSKLDSIIFQLENIMATETELKAAIAGIQDSIAAQTTVVQSVVVLIQNLTGQMQQAIDDGDITAIQTLKDALVANTATLAGAVPVNTGAASETPPAVQSGSQAGATPPNVGTSTVDTGAPVTGMPNAGQADSGTDAVQGATEQTSKPDLIP